MSTCRDLIEETKGHLYAGTREPMNSLAGSHDASTTTFNFNHELNFAAGAVLAVDLELVYVWSVSGLTATVARGWGGSTAATHATGALVAINPRFPDFTIFRALNADLADLSSPLNGLFQMKTVDLTYSAAVAGYDLTGVTDLLDVYEVRYDESGPAKQWPSSSWLLKRNSSTTDFASGHALVLTSGVDPGATVRVSYKAPFAPLTGYTDNVQTIAGLSAFADDLPPLGAAMRLSGVREGARNIFEAQGDTRRALEVPAGAQTRVWATFQEIRRGRIEAEAARLAQQYPPRLRRLASTR